MTVCFCGHRDISASQDALRIWLYDSLEVPIRRGADLFYLGGYGAFDRMTAAVSRELKQTHSGKAPIGFRSRREVIILSTRFALQKG